MNVLFLTLANIKSIEDRNIYTDLLREFRRHGHSLYIASPVERSKSRQSYLISEEHVFILKVKTGNMQKVNYIEKGISTLLIEYQFLNQIKKHFIGMSFDLVLYSTPPITFVKPIRYIKKRDNAYTYLLLKDIFPQNAVDIGVLSCNGIKKSLYQFFRKKEIQLYMISDQIGCMSEANVQYVTDKNTFLSPSKVEVCPNSITPNELPDRDLEKRKEIRKKHHIPTDKVVFVYGGNLGKPQGIPFLIECLIKNEEEDNSFILIIGNGTEYRLLTEFFQYRKPQNAKLLNFLPKKEYDELLLACDVGLLFLSSCFTIPNFPSRLLSYMESAMPVIAATDINTDVGEIIEAGIFGRWCESKNPNDYIDLQRFFLDSQIRFQYGSNARKYLEEHYTVSRSYQIIVDAAGRRTDV